MSQRSLPLATLALLIPIATADAAGPEPTQEKLRQSVTRGLRIVEKAAHHYPEHRQCFSCHHQTLPMFAMVRAREHGVSIEDSVLDAAGEFSAGSFRERIGEMAQGKGIGGAAMTVGY